jgi:hypothetical protein
MGGPGEILAQRPHVGGGIFHTEFIQICTIFGVDFDKKQHILPVAAASAPIDDIYQASARTVTETLCGAGVVGRELVEGEEDVHMVGRSMAVDDLSVHASNQQQVNVLAFSRLWPRLMLSRWFCAVLARCAWTYFSVCASQRNQG